MLKILLQLYNMQRSNTMSQVSQIYLRHKYSNSQNIGNSIPDFILHRSEHSVFRSAFPRAGDIFSRDILTSRGNICDKYFFKSFTLFPFFYNKKRCHQKIKRKNKTSNNVARRRRRTFADNRSKSGCVSRYN